MVVDVPLTTSVVARFADAAPSALLPVDLSPDAMRRVEAGRDALRDATRDGAVYGVTTGVGALRHVDVSADQPADGASHWQRIWRSHAAGIGRELDDATARATMLIRLNQLLRGRSGVAPQLIRALADALSAGAIPRLHSYGSIGTGDLTVLAELGLALVGELPWRSGGSPAVDGADGDALAFISSNAATTAVGSLATVRLAGLARVAEQVAALSHLALRGAGQAYDPQVHAAKDDPAQQDVAARMAALLRLPDERRETARIQDPLALRTVPQVHGPLLDALAAAERALNAEIGASAENPLAVDGTALHHGQFLTQRLAATLDGARAAVYPVASLSAARTSALMDPALTGLPAFLAGGPQGSSGLMIVEYVAQDVLARMRQLTTPVTSARAVVSLGLEEHASFSTQAAWASKDLAALVPDLIGCELIAAVRALRIAPERLAECPAVELFRRADREFPEGLADQVLGPQLRAASAIVAEAASRVID